jgi:hypothetical protein
MITIKQAATDFLAYKRIAVTGVSRNPEGHGSNAVASFRRHVSGSFRSRPRRRHPEWI